MEAASGPPLLFARSRFSLMAGAASPAALCARALAGGYGAVALADLGNLYALPEFVDAALERGLKPLAAARLDRRGGGAGAPGAAGTTGAPGGDACVYALALDRRGFARLNRLLSQSLAVQTALRRFRMPPEALEAVGFEAELEGRERVTGALRGRARASAPRAQAPAWDPVASLIEEGWEGLALASADPAALSRLAVAARARGERLPYALLEAGRPQAALARFARDAGLSVLAGQDARHFEAGDRERIELLEAIEARATLSALRAAPARRPAGPETDCLDSGAWEARFSAFPEALSASRALAEEAASALSFFSAVPIFPAWRGLSEAEALVALGAACRAGAARRYGPAGLARRDVAARLERELRIIGDKGFSGYFLVVRDIVARCPRTCGRGSAASSLASYLLGITHVDPLAHDLFFERFLNEGRRDPPDIDVDFPWDERPAVIRSVLADFPGRAALVADHCGFSGRSAIREPALALGLAADEVGRLVREARLKGPEALGEELAQAADLVRGVPRYIGTHPGGVVITPQPTTDYVHVQTSPLGYPVIAWEKDGTERAGLVKIDLLGNRSLAVLRDCIELSNRALGLEAGEAQAPGRASPVGRAAAGAGLERAAAREAAGPGAGGLAAAGAGLERAGAREAAESGLGGISARGWVREEGEGPGSEAGSPLALSWERFGAAEEAEARALIETGNTVGIFYIESPATRRLLRRMGLADYEHLVAASSIIRPAANRFVDAYVHRLHGEPWRRLSEPVEAALAETYGIMVYQEDVSRVAMAAAGFDAVEADALRKTLSKKRNAQALADYRERFASGCRERGIKPRDARELWEMMASFDGYSFCKAHSASYALVSFRLAWMKARRPAEFMVSVINNGGGFYDLSTYACEARRLGLEILGPDVNESAVEWTVERRQGRPAALRIGLGQLCASSRAFALRVVEERASGGRFRSAIDFFERSRPDSSEARACVLSGSLDALPLEPGGPEPERVHLLWAWHRWRRGGQDSGGGLFPSWAPPEGLRAHGPGLRLAHEVETLGFVASRHPAELFRDRAALVVERLGLPPLVESQGLEGALGRRVSIAGVAAARKEVITKHREAMCFVSLEDPWGIFDAVLFPQAWSRLVPMLEEHDAVLVVGEPRSDQGAIAIQVEDAYALDRARRGI